MGRNRCCIVGRNRVSMLWMCFLANIVTTESVEAHHFSNYLVGTD